MTTKHTKPARIALTSLTCAALLAPLSNAATTASKGGMQSTDQMMTTEPRTALGGIATDEMPIISKGVVEFGLNGYIDWTDDVNYATNLSYGRFITDNWLLGAKLGLTGENSDVNFSGGVFAEYNFLTDTKWVPFVGLGANWKRLDSGSFDTDAIEMAGEVGVKYFLRSNMAVSASISGTWVSDSLPDSDDFGSRVTFGLRYFF